MDWPVLTWQGSEDLSCKLAPDEVRQFFLRAGTNQIIVTRRAMFDYSSISRVAESLVQKALTG